MISFEEAHANFRYDQKTGHLWWRIRDSNRRMDKPCGSISNGYVCIGFRYKLYRRGRLIWFMKTGKWPLVMLDHKDGNRQNDRWNNLREATREQNKANCLRYKNNKSGHKGVTWHKQHKKWYATIQKNKKPRFLGLFNTKQAAYSAYKTAAKKYFGEFARAA